MALATALSDQVRAQAVPNDGERVESLVTFGAQSDKQWGDDDFTQTFFFLIPEKQRTPVYIRVFDPDCGGKNDDLKGAVVLFASAAGKHITGQILPIDGGVSAIIAA